MELCLEMSLPKLALRTKRKYERDGMTSLLTEGVYFIAELGSVRSLVRKQIIESNDISIVNYDQLRNSSSVLVWETFDEGEEPHSSEPIPPKIGVSASRDFDQIETHSPTAPAVFEIPNCTLIHPFGLTLQNGNVIKETISKGTGSRIEKALSKSVAKHGYRSINSLVGRTYPHSLQRLSSATPLVPLWNNYYHWTVECLPRLAGVERYEAVTGNEPTIIVPENPPSWMRESLALLGISADRWQQLDDHYTVDQLVVPTHPGPTPAECRWLHDRMDTAIDDKSSIVDGSTDYRIYISRQSATRRRVKNETQVLDTLRSYGFERYALEELSVVDQIVLFSNAEIIVSPHGAGLANIVYSESPTIVELFGESKKTTFYRLAELLDHNYCYLHNPTHFGDIVVDTEQLEQYLDEMNLVR